LTTELGLPAWVVFAFVQPLVIYLLAFLLREIILRIVLLRESREERIRRWRRVSLYATVFLGIVAVGLFWRAASLDWLHSNLSPLSQSPQLRSFLRGTVYAVVATAILLFVLTLIAKGYQVLRKKVDTWVSGGETVQFQRASLVSRRRLGQTIRVGLKVVAWFAGLTAFYLYIPIVLGFFPATAPYAGQLAPYVLAPFRRVTIGVVSYLPNLFTLIVIVTVSVYALRLLRVVSAAVEKGQIALPGFDPEWGVPTYRLARIVVILLTIIVSYPYLPGSGSEIFQGFSIFIGAMVTLGATAAINNIISGVVLTYTRSFRNGDRVQIGDVQGDVIEKGLFVTRLRSWKNEAITIPNGKVLSGDVVNLSAAAREDGLAILIPAGIGYDTEWRQVHELMEKAALATEGIEADPKPFVLQTELDSYAVSYLLVAKTMEPKKKRHIESALRQNVLDLFNEAGIEIMTPSVTAVRDANQPAIPESFDPQPSQFPGFRLLWPNPKR
jgi:small-conductance mechanosensitive channel